MMTCIKKINGVQQLPISLCKNQQVSNEKEKEHIQN